jgi:hypothetical protein
MRSVQLRIGAELIKKRQLRTKGPRGWENNGAKSAEDFSVFTPSEVSGDQSLLRSVGSGTRL